MFNVVRQTEMNIVLVTVIMILNEISITQSNGKIYHVQNIMKIKVFTQLIAEYQMERLQVIFKEENFDVICLTTWS